MADPVPSLVPRPPGRSLRLLGTVFPGVRAVNAQIGPYTEWWNEKNRLASEASGPLLVAIGDSTAVGIGASGPDRSYVALLGAALTQRDDRRWRIVNLAVSGARLADALERQLPALANLRPDAVTCCIGSNDLVWGREVTGLGRHLSRLVEGLPSCTVVGSLAGSSARGRLANRALRAATSNASLSFVDPWSEPGPGVRERMASDRFHPNDLGYELMSRPFGRGLGIEYRVPDSDPAER